MTKRVTNEYTKYRHHKNLAKGRNIPFDLTFEEWWDIWQKSGKWEQRGRKRGQYVMSRFNDTGPYAINNVEIKKQEDNFREGVLGNKNRLGHITPKDVKHKIRLSKLGKKHSLETKEKIRQARLKKIINISN
jgi:hypothetical protein